MATAKLFLHYTANYKDQYDQVIRLIMGPIRTLIMGREPEVAYAVLCNVQVLAARQPEPFRVMVSDIFYRPEDTRYLKIAKLDLMVRSRALTTPLTRRRRRLSTPGTLTTPLQAMQWRAFPDCHQSRQRGRHP